MNILFCSAGKHGKLIQDLKAGLDSNSRIIATSNKVMVPSLYFADKNFIVPDVKDETYLPTILEICKAERINAVTTMLDVETELLARNREVFEDMGILVLAPFLETARLCFDKYLMYQFLVRNGIKTIKTYVNLEEFSVALDKGEIEFPVFVKPRSGQGSVGARRISTYSELVKALETEDDLLIQEFIDGIDIDVDVYIDAISGQPVSIFSKKKLETKIGGATVTVSFKDDNLFSYIATVVSKLRFCGPIDVDVFYKNGEYYLTEINPRFGAAYLHAHGCGVNFMRLLDRNLNGIQNKPEFGNYPEDVVMMMYNSALIIDKTCLPDLGRGFGI